MIQTATQKKTLLINERGKSALQAKICAKI